MEVKLEKVTCPNCGSTKRVAKVISGILYCDHCGYPLSKDRTKKRGSVTKKRSKDQERRAGKRYGMDLTPASGSMDHSKGDLVKKGELRGECKYTAKASYSLKRETLEKIESEAQHGELPFMEVEFQNAYPYKRFIIMPDWAFLQLRNNDDKDT